MTNPYASPEADLTKDSSGGEGVSVRTIQILKQTKKWANRTKILLAFMALGRVINAATMLRLQIGRSESEATENDVAQTLQIGIDTIHYLVWAVIPVVLAIYAHRYAVAISKLLEDGQIPSLEAALEMQASFWRIFFITFIVEVSFNVFSKLLVGAVAVYFS